jgi:hypothetical protein
MIRRGGFIQKPPKPKPFPNKNPLRVIDSVEFMISVDAVVEQVFIFEWFRSRSVI